MSITCRKAAEFIVKKEEGKITLWQRWLLWRHTAACSLCKLFSQQDKVISASLKQAAKHRHSILEDADKDAMVSAMNESCSRD